MTEIEQKIHAVMEARFGEQLAQYVFPPPVFETMQASFEAFNQDQGALTVRFPVLESWLNPYGIMQGGMVAAAIDNAVGPLSVLVAPPSVTRRMDLKYSRAVSPKMGFIKVTARLTARDRRWLTFEAQANDPDGKRLVRAKAVHWILDAE